MPWQKHYKNGVNDMREKDVENLLLEKKVGSLTVNCSEDKVIEEFGEPQDISVLKNKTKILSYFDRVIQITIFKKNVYLIAIEFSYFTKTDLIQHSILKSVVRFFSSMEMERLIGWLNKNQYRYTFSKSAPDNVVLLENDIEFVFDDDKKIDSIQFKGNC